MNCAATIKLEFEPSAKTASPAPTPGVSRPIQVLLIEDDAEAAALVRISLSSGGEDHFRIEWSTYLREAMIRLTEPGIDVVLLDLGMPELSGYKSYRAVRVSAGNGLPIVVLTADEDSESRGMTLASGAADYLLKDHISPAELRRALREAVVRSRTLGSDRFEA